MIKYVNTKITRAMSLTQKLSIPRIYRISKLKILCSTKLIKEFYYVKSQATITRKININISLL